MAKEDKSLKSKVKDNKVEKKDKAIKGDLSSEIKEKQEKLLDLKIGHKMGKLKNPNEIRGLRREIARLKTKIRLKSFVKGV